jgi:probable metal-binding protein
MSQSVHGHEVLYLLLNAKSPVSRVELERKVEELYGKDPRFHTCSVEGMTLDHLIEFLERRGKITLENGSIRAHREKMCNH